MASATFEITPETVAKRLNRQLGRDPKAFGSSDLTPELLSDWLMAHGDELDDHTRYLLGALMWAQTIG